SGLCVLDRVPSRLGRAQTFGVVTFNVDEADWKDRVKAWTGGNGAGVVIVTPSKTPVIQQGIELVAPGGTLMMYGPPAPDDRLSLDANYTFFKEITITSSYSASPYDTRRTLSLLASGTLDYRALITHRFPLQQADQAWHMTKAAGDSLKIVVEMG
ncbi:MAG: zinc-binding dehydrogenase, partial [Aggregatilineales bacterium]